MLQVALELEEGQDPAPVVELTALVLFLLLAVDVTFEVVGPVFRHNPSVPPAAPVVLQFGDVVDTLNLGN